MSFFSKHSGKELSPIAMQDPQQKAMNAEAEKELLKIYE